MKCLLLLSLMLCCCIESNAQRTTYHSLTPTMWLEGSWSGLHKGAPFYEAWRKVSDSLLINFSIEIKGADTVVKENLAMRLISDGSVRVFGSQREVWTASRLTDDELVLENDTLK